jgi:tetratricopeptide (TPR) repeat protein
MACMAAGRPAEARSALERVLALEPGNAKAQLKLGTLALQLGDRDAALRHFRAAVEARPRYAKAESSLGNLLRELGRAAEALPHLERGWRLRPGEPGIVNNYALGLAAAGRTEEAVVHLRSLVSTHPAQVIPLANLGSLLLALERPSEALEPLERAIALAPQLIEARANHANALMALDRFAEARAELGTLVARAPDLAGAWVNLGHLARIEGRLDEAARCMERAAQIDPQNVEALAELAAQQRERIPPERRQVIERLVGKPDLQPRERSRLHFALAAIHAGADEADLAFQHLSQGNAIRRAEDQRAGRGFDPAAHRAFVDRLIATFKPALFARFAGAGSESDMPVYVVGMPRSGTTLVEQILASHPAIEGAGERSDLDGLSRRVAADARVPYPDCVVGLAPSAVGRMGDEIAARLAGLAPGATRVVDKAPVNFLHLGLAALVLPRARIIHCRRDPVATGFSCFEQNFRSGHAWSRDLGDIGRFHREYARLMHHWRDVLPMPVHEIRYEELVADPERAIRGLLAFCGVAWDARCLDFHRTDRPVRTASQRQVRRPLYGTSLDRWRRYEAQLGPLLEELNDPTVADS